MAFKKVSKRNSMREQRSERRTQITAESANAASTTHGAQEAWNPHIPELLTYVDLARITGESVMTHRRRKMFGTGPRALRIGRHIRFHPRDVAEWLEQCASNSRNTEIRGVKR